MLDCGATCNVVKPGLLQRVTSEVAIQVTRFDGTNTTKRKVKKGVANIFFDGNQFSDIPVIEWPMSNSQDVILGKPWFTAHEPIINWRTHQVSFKGGNIPQDEVFEPVIISSADFSRKLKTSKYEEVYRVKIYQESESTKPREKRLKSLLDSYKDVFPEKLPNSLPPNRSVEFEINMQPGAQPSNRPPFRLSQVEQNALQKFVDENLSRGWIELSDSPWVSNIFGIPKKDPKTGTSVSRSEWIRSGNANILLRWVIDFRYVNSKSVVPKIHLPRADDLSDKMQGMSYYTVIDLA